MKEIRILMQNLRSYPNNLFIIPDVDLETENGGLQIVDKDGNKIGYIETGVRKDIVITS